MENKMKQERVLAYTLAKEIKKEDLDQVAGGYGTGGPASNYETFGGRDHITDTATD